MLLTFFKMCVEAPPPPGPYDSMVTHLLGHESIPLWQVVLNLIMDADSNWLHDIILDSFEELARFDIVAHKVFSHLYQAVASPGSSISERVIRAKFQGSVDRILELRRLASRSSASFMDMMA